MRRWYLWAAVAGCGGGEEPLGLRLDSVDPSLWRSCGGPVTLTFSGSVAESHGGSTLSAEVALGDVDLGGWAVEVRADGSFELEVEAEELPPCAGEQPCEVAARLALGQGERQELAETTLTLLPSALPERTSATAGSSALDDLIAAAPDATLLVAEVPELSATLTDASLGLGPTTASALLCPEEADPDEESARCLEVPGIYTPAADGSGAELTVPTGGMPALACSPLAVADRSLFRLWARVEGHDCADPAHVLLSELPFRVSDGDCDDDGAPADGDCDDLDPDTYPGAPEVWYDDLDQACDGGDDHDADGDGFAAPSGGGEDCDDALATVFPGATEVCDGADNDCLPGGLPDGSVTLFPADGGAPVTGTDLALALATAPAGSTIGLCPGEHVGPFLLARDLTLAGDPGRPTRLVGAGPDAGPVIGVAAGVSATLSDLVITGGSSTVEGGGLAAPSPASLLLQRCEVVDNEGAKGGGLFVGGGSLHLVESVVRSNRGASSGGGLEIRDASLILDVGTRIEDNEVTGVGGGLALRNADVIADPGVQIAGNRAGTGGGVYGTGVMSWDGGTLTGNTAEWGGGMSFDNLVRDGSVRVARVLATDNVATEGGGGLEFERTPELSLDGVIATGNTATDGGGILLLSTGVATFNGVEVSDNDAQSGGGVSVLGDGEITTLTTLAGAISGNRAAADGGGLSVQDASLTLGQGLASTAVHDNVAQGRGGGIAARRSLLSAITADVRRNQAAEGGGLDLEEVEGELVDGVVRENAATALAPSLSLRASRVRLDGTLEVDSGAAVPGVVVEGEILVACSNVDVVDLTRNQSEERQLAACFDARATSFQTYTPPDCNPACD